MKNFLRYVMFGSGLFVLPFIVQAATLQASPARATVNVGDTFTTTVLVSSADQAMNAASGELSFAPDLLSVSSIRRTLQ